jgi:hypothetical protein
MTHNVLQLQEVGDYEDENCLPPLSLTRSTKLLLTTEPPISFRCCYGLVFLTNFTNIGENKPHLFKLNCITLAHKGLKSTKTLFYQEVIK